MNDSRNLLQYSMQAGVWLGLYLIVRFVCSVASIYSPMLNLIAMILLVGTPFVLYHLMKKYHKNNDDVSTFSLMWMMGIMLFAFASLICAVPEYLFYEYINPDYITNTMQQSVSLIKEMDLIKDDTLMQELEKISTTGAVPTSIQMIMSSLWSNVFFGSLLSFVVAIFVVRSKK